MKKLFITIIFSLALTLCASSVLANSSFIDQVRADLEERLVEDMGGTLSTMRVLPQWKSTSTPENAITPRTAGKDVYAPFSNATFLTVNASSTTATSTFGNLEVTGNLDLDMTQGSVPFIDANGKLAQDNANLQWLDSTNVLAIGNSTDIATGVSMGLAVHGRIKIGANDILTGNQHLFIRGQNLADPDNLITVQNSAANDLFSLLSNALNVNVKSTFNSTGGYADFNVKGHTDDDLFYVDASTDRIGIGTNAPGAVLDVRGGGDVWFNVAGTGGDLFVFATGGTGLHVDVSTKTTGIGTPANGVNPLLVLAEDASSGIKIEDATAGAWLTMGAGNSNSSIKTNHGSLRISTGSTVENVNFQSNETAFNDDGIGLDFRVEGVGEANALFVQGSDGFTGLNTAVPTEQLHVTGMIRSDGGFQSVGLIANNTSGAGANLTAGSDRAVFMFSGGQGDKFAIQSRSKSQVLAGSTGGVDSVFDMDNNGSVTWGKLSNNADITFQFDSSTNIGSFIWKTDENYFEFANNIMVNSAYLLPSVDGALGDIITADGAGTSSFKTPTTEIPIVISMFDPAPSRSNETNWNGGLLALDTGSALDSVPTNIVVTKGIGKIMISVNAGSDITGDITITGTSVNRDTGATTIGDTDTITVDALTTDNSVVDANGHKVHDFTGAYISSKWFEGTVTLSTTNLTLTDVDTNHISFEQFNDNSNIVINTLDANIFTTSVNAEFDAYLHTVHVTGSKVNIDNEASLHVGAIGATAIADRYERLRRGNINEAIDGATDGFWVDVNYANSPAYVEDVTLKLWATQTQVLDLN